MIGLSHDEALTDLRRSQDRSFESEGIPMVLALLDEVGTSRPASDPVVRSDGRGLAESMDAYRRVLVPNSRDDDLGSLISVLQSLSYANFGVSATDSLDLTDSQRQQGDR